MSACVTGDSTCQFSGWLPGTQALVALARNADAWRCHRHDPGFVVLFARHLHTTRDHSPSLLRDALHLLNHGIFVDWHSQAVRHCYFHALRTAGLAEAIAARVNRTEPAHAWIAGFLASLGELAGATGMGPDSWRKLGPVATGRRLARRWGLPEWLRIIIGYGHLPAEQVLPPDADATIFQVVQLSRSMLTSTDDPSMGPGIDRDGLLRNLGLSCNDLPIPPPEPATETSGGWADPRREALLPDLLRLAVDRAGCPNRVAVTELEAEVDRLQAALGAAQENFQSHVHEAKLRSLAEFAAGAGHEINNPLAVISAQSQFLLPRVGDASAQAALNVIIRQTQRIHQILVEVMQFARPPKPVAEAIDVAALVAAVAGAIENTAAERGVKLEWAAPIDPLWVLADPAMVRSALLALVRNGVEANASGGWVRIRASLGVDHDVIITIDDSGCGPTALAKQHLFDPFFSGRSAGRGRGMGLPMAWRYAIENAGDLRFAPAPEAPSRFILQLPATQAPVVANAAERLCA